MFVDKAEIFIKSGKGGDGRVSFRREKYVPDGGPDGGDGGRGGDIYAIVDSGMRTLMDFRYKRKYVAEPGEDGGKKNKFGKDAEDLIIKVPPGTIVKEKESGRIIADLIEPGEKKILAKGGKGGKGNTHFKNAVRQAPTFAQQGRKGQEYTIILELKMLADVGLVGYPNVGKSTLLSVLTKATPKIANYHFTTLKPNLGVVEVIKGKSFVLADIPGLIEGASEGVGLGHDFLRHVERTKLLVHVVDVSGVEGRNPIEDFDNINKELLQYDSRLGDKVQVVAANKTDIIYDEDVYNAFIEEMEKRGHKVFPISAATQQGIIELMEYVTMELDHIEDVVLVTEDEHAFYDLDEQQNQEILYTRDGDVYVVDGDPIERLVYSTNFSDVESLRRFQNILQKQGVFDKLREMGIEDGDTVRIFDFEFDYYE
ncbi:MAG: GTPase ObgE [Clostridia bacterium]|nr:GTPase ObgE [Clostridia bacterium]